MNRSITNVLFGGIAAPAESDYKIEGQITKTNVDEVVESLTNAESVIIVSFFIVVPNGSSILMSNRLLATEWPLQKHNMPLLILHVYCGAKASMSDLRYIQSLEECLDNAMFFLRKLPCLMIVSKLKTS